MGISTSTRAEPSRRARYSTRRQFPGPRIHPYPDSNVVQPTEYGVYGTKAQGEIADERSRIDRKSTLDERVERAGSQSKQQERTQEKQPERDGDGPELEME